MRTQATVLALTLALGLGACGEPPMASRTAEGIDIRAQIAEGSGLELRSVTGISLPLIGRVGDVVVDQAVVTNLRLIEDAVGQIVGLEVDGVLQLTGGVLGTDVVTEDFSTQARVTSSGPGQCTVIAIDLGPISVDALVARVDVPVASVDVRASGAVGSLLCQLAALLSTGASIADVQPVVDAINAEI